MEIAPPTFAQWERVEQLTQRVNQFNNTTRRWNSAELREEIFAKGGHCFAIMVKDRFGTYGLSGAVIAKIFAAKEAAKDWQIF